MVQRDIIAHFESNNGNIDGLPVSVIFLNIRWDLSFATANAFVQRHNLKIVANDFVWTTWAAYGGGAGHGTPHFAVINGVADSPSHQQWQIVWTHEGWGGATTINNIRTQINSVQAPPPPPVLGHPQIIDNKCEFTITSDAGINVCIESTSDFITWSPAITRANPTGTFTFRDEIPANGILRAYRAQLK